MCPAACLLAWHMLHPCFHVLNKSVNTSIMLVWLTFCCCCRLAMACLPPCPPQPHGPASFPVLDTHCKTSCWLSPLHNHSAVQNYPTCQPLQHGSQPGLWRHQCPCLMRLLTKTTIHCPGSTWPQCPAFLPCLQLCCGI